MKKTLCLLFLVPQLVNAQYIADAPLTPVQAEGFYQVPLPPRVTAMLSEDMHNIRIVDQNGSEVPYVTIVDRPKYGNIEWMSFRMDKQLDAGCCTVVTLYNDDRKTINNFLLEIKNAAIEKNAILRGSDNGKTWYALREKIHLSIGELNGKKVLEVLDFPASDYPYYQLTISDQKSSPLNIVGAWLTNENILDGMYVRVPSVTFTQKDSAQGRYSLITLHSDTSQYIHRLEFDIEGPRFYKRTVTGLDQSFDVISGQTPVIYVHTKDKDIKLRVDNENNPPLTFKDIRAYQLRQSIVAYLEPGKDYRIAIGADSIAAPVYDLGFFKDSIPANPTEIEIGALRKQATKAEVKTTPVFFRDPKLIWAAIILVIIVLTGMTVRMLREQEEQKQ